MSREDVRTNLASWEADSEAYQQRNRAQLNRWDLLGWGVWDIPEDHVGALGDVSGLDALELGCGACQLGIKVAMRGARVMGLDFSANQLRAAGPNFEETGPFVEFRPTYGEWVRLFRTCGLAIEDLIELRPPADADTTYTDFAPLAWARDFPGEHIWKLRKEPS